MDQLIDLIVDDDNDDDDDDDDRSSKGIPTCSFLTDERMEDTKT